MNRGAVLIATDKVYSTSAKIQDMFTFLYYDYKKSFFSDAEILEKEKSLREIQAPQTEAENVSMFKDAGFSYVDCFWKYYNFQGWICLK
jgi:tRNA (cmo5U34)-methyltransferase